MAPIRDAVDFIPPYSTTFVQRQFKIIQQRKQSGSSTQFGNNVLNNRRSRRTDDPIESRCSNYGGSFSVHSANDKRVHHSQRTFGLVRPNNSAVLDNYYTSTEYLAKQRKGGYADPKVVKKDSAASYAMRATYNKLARDSAAKMSHRSQLARGSAVDKNGVLLRDAAVQDKPWMAPCRDARAVSVNSYVNPESSIKGNLKKSYAKVHHWPGQMTDAHRQDEEDGGWEDEPVEEPVYAGGAESLQVLNQDAITLLRTPSANMSASTPVPRYGDSDALARSLARSVGNDSNPKSSSGAEEDGDFNRASFGSSSGLHSRVRAKPRPKPVQHHVNSNVKAGARRNGNELVDGRGHVKQHSMHYVKCVQYPMHTHSPAGREIAPTVVSKLVCLPHGIRRDELVGTLERQLLVTEDLATGTHITDVTITYPLNQYSYTSTLVHPGDQTADSYSLQNLLGASQNAATRSTISPQKVPDRRQSWRARSLERGLGGTGNTVSLALSTIPEHPELNNVDCAITVYTCPEVVLHAANESKDRFNNTHHVHTLDAHSTLAGAGDSDGNGGRAATPTLRLHGSAHHNTAAHNIRLNAAAAPRHRYSLQAQSAGSPERARAALQASLSTPTATQADIKYNNNLLHISRQLNHSNSHHHSLNYFVPAASPAASVAGSGADRGHGRAPMTVKEIIAESAAKSARGAGSGSSSVGADPGGVRSQSVADVRLQVIRSHLRGSSEGEGQEMEMGREDEGQQQQGRVELNDFIEQSPSPERGRLGDSANSNSAADERLAQVRERLRGSSPGAGGPPLLNTVASRSINSSAHSGPNTADLRLAHAMSNLRQTPVSVTPCAGTTSGSADVRLAQARAAIRGERAADVELPGYSGTAVVADCNNTADIRLGMLRGAVKGQSPSPPQRQAQAVGGSDRNTLSNRALGGSVNSGPCTADVRLSQVRRQMGSPDRPRGGTSPGSPPFTAGSAVSALTPSPSVIDLRLKHLRQQMRQLIAEDRAMEQAGRGGPDDYDGEPESEGEYMDADDGADTGYGWVEPTTEPQRFLREPASGGAASSARMQAVSPISESSGSLPASRHGSFGGSASGNGNGNGPSPSQHRQFRQGLIEPEDSEDGSDDHGDYGYDDYGGSPDNTPNPTYDTNGSDTSYIQEDSGDDDTEFNVAAELARGRHVRDRDLHTRSAPAAPRDAAVPLSAPARSTPLPAHPAPVVPRSADGSGAVRRAQLPAQSLSQSYSGPAGGGRLVSTSLHTNNSADVRLQQVMAAMKSSNGRLAAAVDASSGSVCDIRLQQVKQQIQARQAQQQQQQQPSNAARPDAHASDGEHAAPVSSRVGVNLPLRQQLASPRIERERDWGSYQLHGGQKLQQQQQQQQQPVSQAAFDVGAGSANVVTYEIDFDSLLQ